MTKKVSLRRAIDEERVADFIEERDEIVGDGEQVETLIRAMTKKRAAEDQASIARHNGNKHNDAKPALKLSGQ